MSMLRELLDEPVGDLDEVLASEPPTEADIVLARRLIIAHEQAKARLAEQKATKAAVVQTYDLRLGAIQAQIDQVRGWLDVYVTRHGKLSLPDVGSVYHQTRTTKPKVSDPETALAFALEHDPDLVTQVPHLDVEEYLAMAQTILDVRGEVIPGFDPGGETTTSLVVKA